MQGWGGEATALERWKKMLELFPDSAFTSFTLHNITPMITLASQCTFHAGRSKWYYNLREIIYHHSEVLFWFGPALVDARVKTGAPRVKMYWEKIVISDAITRTVNLEIELLGEEQYGPVFVRCYPRMRGSIHPSEQLGMFLNKTCFSCRPKPYIVLR